MQWLEWPAFFAIGWGQPLLAYAALQAGALLTLRGRWRAAAMVPLPLMLVVVVHMAWAYHQEATLWPMTMLMTAPGAALAVLAIWLLALVRAKRWNTLLVPIATCLLAALVAVWSGKGIALLVGGERSAVIAALLAGLGLAVAAVAKRAAEQGIGPDGHARR